MKDAKDMAERLLAMARRALVSLDLSPNDRAACAAGAEALAQAEELELLRCIETYARTPDRVLNLDAVLTDLDALRANRRAKP